MPANFWLSAAAISAADCPRPLPFIEWLQGALNTIPEFGLLVNPLIERPRKRHGVSPTPGCFKAILAHPLDDRLGPVERGGIGKLRKRRPDIACPARGTKPVGRRREPPATRDRSTRRIYRKRGCRRHARFAPRRAGSRWKRSRKSRLKGRKNHPSRRLIRCCNRSGAAPPRPSTNTAGQRRRQRQ